jgi:hypothetical protein
MSLAPSLPAQGVLLRHSRWDALLIALAGLHGVVLLAWPVAPVIAVGLWWNSNTIAHYFIHCPFFHSRRLNALFGLYQSVLLGVPQSIWRDRHLAHHAGVRWRLRMRPQLLAEIVLVVAVWSALVCVSPRFFLTVYVPGYVAGMCLCYLHGYYEHVRGTVSHYGVLYNLLFFNDGYHVEHHAAPGTHWIRLPTRMISDAEVSRWPAVLRWLDVFSLDGLERWALRSPMLQSLLLRTHERAFRQLMPRLSNVRRIMIVGGGMFPRTPLILRKLFPHAKLVVVDRSAANIETARGFLTDDLECVHAPYRPEDAAAFDLLVIPLAFVGDRPAIYRQPPAAAVVVHDWLWRRRGVSAVVSLFLLKRLNLVKR